MFKFICFGSGSSGNSYLLYTDTDALLIDCGVGIRKLKKYFTEYGLRFDKISNILVTHDHADHVKSIGSLVDKIKRPVYTTKEIHHGIYANWCVKKKIPLDLQHHICKGETVMLGDFEVTAFGVPHDSTDCLGYSIRCCDVTFTIITDCGHITEEIVPFIAKADYLVIEANHDKEMLRNGPYPKYLQDRIAGPRGHLPNDECGESLATYATPRLRHVWLCHLSEENNHPELAFKTVEQILRNHGIVVGKDFKLDVLKRTTPSEIFDLS